MKIQGYPSLTLFNMVRTVVPNPVTGSIIGRAGAGLRSLFASCGASASIERSTVGSGHSEERIVALLGTAAAVETAASEIALRVAAEGHRATWLLHWAARTNTAQDTPPPSPASDELPPQLLGDDAPSDCRSKLEMLPKKTLRDLLEEELEGTVVEYDGRRGHMHKEVGMPSKVA